MADNQIEFDIVARLDAVDKSLGDLKSKADKTGKDLQESLGGKLESSVKASFLGIVGAAAAAGAAVLSGLAFKQVIAAAAEEENAINALNQSLASAGTYSEAASQGIQDFATEIERTTTVSDDAAVGLVALARNFTKTNEEAVKLTSAAIDLSAATGVSLDSAVESLGKTLTGNVGRLGQSVAAVRGFTEAQLKAGAAIDAVSERFAGAGASKINTFSGAYTQLENTFNNLQEAIGRIIIKSPALIAVFKYVSEYIRDFTASVTAFSKSNGDIFGGIISGAIAVGRVLNVALIGPLEFVFNLVNIAFQTIRTGIQSLLVGVVTIVQGIANVAGLFTDKFDGLIGTINTFADSSKATLEDFSTKNLEAITNTFDFAGTQAGDAFLAGMQASVDKASAIGPDMKNNVDGNKVAVDALIKSVNLFDEVYTALSTNVAISSAKQIQAFKQVKQAMFQNLVTGFQSAFSSIGSALVKGENVFAAFGKAILGMFGDIALQLGQFYLLLGIGNLWLNPAAAAGQIAAGIGLSILGGALKALAGGGGGATAPTAAATGGGVGGGGFTAAPGDDTNGFQETQQQDPGTQVAVNIYGPVLGDKRTLGAAVVEAINESFASDGTVIARGAFA